MAYNEKLTNRVREFLVDIPDIEEKRMFRGVVFMVNGKMCITVGDNEIMCRIDPDLQEMALKMKFVRQVVMKGRNYSGYVYIHEDGMITKEDFEFWIKLALDYNKRAKASKKQKKPS